MHAACSDHWTRVASWGFCVHSWFISEQKTLSVHRELTRHTVHRDPASLAGQPGTSWTEKPLPRGSSVTQAAALGEGLLGDTESQTTEGSRENVMENWRCKGRTRVKVKWCKIKVSWHKITTVKKWKQNWRSSFYDIIRWSKKIKQLYGKGHFKTSECPI